MVAISVSLLRLLGRAAPANFASATARAATTACHETRSRSLAGRYICSRHRLAVSALHAHSPAAQTEVQPLNSQSERVDDHLLLPVEAATGRDVAQDSGDVTVNGALAIRCCEEPPWIQSGRGQRRGQIRICAGVVDGGRRGEAATSCSTPPWKTVADTGTV